MSNRAVYDDDQETREMVAWARRARNIATEQGITVLRQHEYDFLVSCYRKGMNPATAVDTLRRWRQM